MKTIGMIGGVSWESTALYYQLINEAVLHQLGGLNSARLLIHSMNYQELVDYKNQNNMEGGFYSDYLTRNYSIKTMIPTPAMRGEA